MLWVRVALVLLVVAWLLDVGSLRAWIPIWLPFVVALGLELEFFLVGARQRAPAPTTSGRRLPQDVDLEELGYGAAGEGELLLVHDDEGEVWVRYGGESDEELEELVAREREREQPGIVPRRGHPVRSLLSGVALVVALAALVWVVESRSGWKGLDAQARRATEARLSAEASRIVGRPVQIRCDESGSYVGAVQHADGVAAVGGRLAYLTPERCFDLYRLAFGGHTSDSQTGRAIAVLAHEAWHLHGVRDEGRTECYALQSGVVLGRRLGLSEETARRLMRQQLVENSLHGLGTEEYRVPAGCRNDGRLDLHPASNRFP